MPWLGASALALAAAYAVGRLQAVTGAASALPREDGVRVTILVRRYEVGGPGEGVSGTDTVERRAR